jgi:hypothetical protein
VKLTKKDGTSVEFVALVQSGSDNKLNQTKAIALEDIRVVQDYPDVWHQNETLWISQEFHHEAGRASQCGREQVEKGDSSVHEPAVHLLAPALGGVDALLEPMHLGYMAAFRSSSCSSLE